MQASRGTFGSSSVIFDCHLTRRRASPGVLTYDGCHVDITNGAMNKTSGIFTVRTEGIYQAINE